MPGTPVQIAGAGPTGLVPPLWLPRAGVPFRLIDKTPSPGTASRAMAVQARTLEFYRQLGLADAAVAAGFRMNRLHLHAPAGEVGTVPFGEIGKGISQYPFALSLPQDDHARLLTAKLQDAGHRVERDAELVGLSQDDRGIRATVRAPRREEVRTGSTCARATGPTAPFATSSGSGYRPNRNYEVIPVRSGSPPPIPRKILFPQRAASGSARRGYATGRSGFE